MNINRQLLKINRNFLVCFVISALVSAYVAQLLSGFESHITTSITIAVGYGIYFTVFFILFYLDNKSRYRQMESGLVKKEIVSLVTSFGVGEVGYLVIRWPSLYYFLEIGIEPYLASLISEVISTACYMTVVSLFLRGTKTF